jgi:OOP family OmpA-OmpF porin
MKKLIFALIASVAAVGAAQAQTANTAPKSYIGLGAATADTNDGYKTSAKIFGGYEFDQHWGVEAGYTDFRKSNLNSFENGKIYSANSDGYGTYVAGKYTAPINDQFSAYGKLGVAYSKRDFDSASGLSFSQHDTGAYAGVGVEYKLNQNVSLNAEYERYGKDKDFGAKADVWTAGVKYSF